MSENGDEHGDHGLKRELKAEEEERKKKAKKNKCILVAKSIQLSIDFTDCWFFKKGDCRRGEACPYKHGR